MSIWLNRFSPGATPLLTHSPQPSCLHTKFLYAWNTLPKFFHGANYTSEEKKQHHCNFRCSNSMCDNNWKLFEFSKFSLEKLKECDKKSETSINSIRLLHWILWHLKCILCDFGLVDFKIGVSMWVQRCIKELLFFANIFFRTTLSLCCILSYLGSIGIDLHFL